MIWVPRMEVAKRYHKRNILNHIIQLLFLVHLPVQGVYFFSSLGIGDITQGFCHAIQAISEA